MEKSGSCLCQAVRFNITNTPTRSGACHCSMCRKWTGGIYLGFQVKPEDVTFEGEDNIQTFTSSDWAERAFCKTCGSNLFYRVTAEGPHQGLRHFGLGSLDDPAGMIMDEEIFIDEKPDAYSFAGETQKMTGAEVFALFAPPE